ncbi:cupin domain-containing protein [Candidatus Entotheonella palauensis]|uniref:ChrR-like cupin domain-containing protein n=1 Tax=Candidatus Entotheonella gemina TaxID=1429439 RepID=W4LCR6_9BACT|nr:cupin domain-containing protein [Candidatus Entotheonella palauensis]ETW95863.1 MAG: hypothetical protein ETSY2_47490 [Candidatus Entotheonella gemina]
MSEPEIDASGYHFTDIASMSWRASIVADGIEVKDLGSANGRVMELVRCRAGTTFPTHHHVGPEFIYLLEGEAMQNGQRLKPGWAGVAEAGTIDADFHSDAGCVFLLIYSEEKEESEG